MVESWPDYPHISLAELATLSFDEQSAYLFQRRFLMPALVAILSLAAGFGGGAYLFESKMIGGDAFATIMIAGGVLSIVISGRRTQAMVRARPRSARTGEEMEPYILEDVTTANHYELAYVDRASGNYFRKIYTELSS